MTGVVDDYGRALIRITVKHPLTGVAAEIDAWVDTAFSGELVLPSEKITALGLPPSNAVEAGLGDGTRTSLNCFACLVDWFGKWKEVAAIASAARFPLLGVGLLEDHELTIDYP